MQKIIKASKVSKRMAKDNIKLFNIKKLDETTSLYITSTPYYTKTGSLLGFTLGLQKGSPETLDIEKLEPICGYVVKETETDGLPEKVIYEIFSNRNEYIQISDSRGENMFLKLVDNSDLGDTDIDDMQEIVQLRSQEAIKEIEDRDDEEFEEVVETDEPETDEEEEPEDDNEETPEAEEEVVLEPELVK